MEEASTSLLGNQGCRRGPLREARQQRGNHGSCSKVKTLNDLTSRRRLTRRSTGRADSSINLVSVLPARRLPHRKAAQLASPQNESMKTETEAVEQFFAAINRNDMQVIAKDFDPEIVRIEPEGFPTAGTYRGIAEVQEHVTKGRGSWAEGTCDPEKFLVNGDKIVVYLHAWVRLKDSTNWVGGRFADGFVFRKGKITQYLSFGERGDALKWAGIEHQEVL